MVTLTDVLLGQPASMSPSSISLSSAASGAVLLNDDVERPEDDGMQDDNSLSNVGS